MNTIKTIITNGTLDDIATLLVATAFGWTNTDEPTEVEEEEAAPFEDNFRIVETHDWEVEHYYYTTDEHGFPTLTADDGCDITQPYFTRSGDNPVLQSQATQADARRSAGGLSDIRQDYIPQFYSTSRYGNGKAQARNFHTILTFIHTNKDNESMLRRGWKRFWARVYAQQNFNFLFSKQINCLRNEFEKHGITARKRN